MDRVQPSRFLRHPLWWSALVLLMMNDHVLKGSGWLPSELTGKLSDFAGLIVAPAVVATIFRARTRWGLWMAHCAIAGLLILINVDPAAARGWDKLGAVLGFHWKSTSDPSDLLALPMLCLSWRGITARTHQAKRLLPSRSNIERAGAIVGAIGCVATSEIPPAVPTLTPTSVTAYDHIGDELIALDRASGEERVRIPFDGWPTVIGHADLAVGAHGDQVRAVDVRTGRQVWGITSEVWRTFACDADVAVESKDYSTYILDATSGARLVALPSGASLVGCAHGLVLYVERDGEDRPGQFVLVAVERQSGRERWRHPWAPADFEWSRPLALGPHLMIGHYGGQGMFGARRGHLLALNPATGDERLRRDLGPQFYLASSDLLVTLTPRGTNSVLPLDVRGRTLWSRTDSLVGAGAGRAFFHSREEPWTLRAIDVRTGGLLWGRPTEPVGFVAYYDLAVADDEMLALRDWGGTVWAFAAEDGRSLWKVHVGDE